MYTPTVLFFHHDKTLGDSRQRSSAFAVFKATFYVPHTHASGYFAFSTCTSKLYQIKNNCVLIKEI